MSTNGKDAGVGAEHKAKERKRGMAAVRESELWNLGSLVEDALNEGAQLARDVYYAAREARMTGRSRSTSELDEVQVVRKLEEALMCAETGEHYLRIVLDQVPFIPYDQEPAQTGETPGLAEILNREEPAF